MSEELKTYTKKHGESTFTEEEVIISPNTHIFKAGKDIKKGSPVFINSQGCAEGLFEITLNNKFAEELEHQNSYPKFLLIPWDRAYSGEYITMNRDFKKAKSPPFKKRNYRNQMNYR